MRNARQREGAVSRREPWACDLLPRRVRRRATQCQRQRQRERLRPVARGADGLRPSPAGCVRQQRPRHLLHQHAPPVSFCCQWHVGGGCSTRHRAREAGGCEADRLLIEHHRLPHLTYHRPWIKGVFQKFLSSVARQYPLIPCQLDSLLSLVFTYIFSSPF